MSIKETKDGASIRVFVKPNQPKFKIELQDDKIVVYSTKEPEKGKVNSEIVKEFSKRLHTQVVLTSGAASRQKQLLAEGLTKIQVEQFLNL